MRHIVVLGSGFGGFRAARELQSALSTRRHVRLTILSKHAHFVYTPLLSEVAGGQLEPSHITFPLRGEFDKPSELVIEEIERIDLKRRRLHGAGRTVDFDYLLIACGAQLDWRGHTAWQEHSLTLTDERRAQRIWRALRDAFEEAASLTSREARRRRLTFVIGGGGPTGVELAADMMAAVRSKLGASVDDALTDAFRLILIEQQPRLVPRWPRELGQHAREYLSEAGVELRLGTAVVDRTAHRVVLSTGEELAADHFVWCGGLTATKLVRQSSFERTDEDRIVVDQTLRVPGHQGIYAIGDAAAPPSRPEARAQIAAQQAPVAAANIVGELSGCGRRAWRYKRRGYLLGLGPDHAVAHLRDATIEGRAAHSVYRMVHTALMPTALKKAGLFKDWLITGRGGDRGTDLLADAREDRD